jgi:hypothetical protein
MASDRFKRSDAITISILGVVQREQGDHSSQKVLSGILWDMFTGNERYMNIFFRAINVPMFYNLFKGVVRR